MSGCVRVLARMAVWGVVAAAGAVALLAGPEMNPLLSDLDALLALVALRVPHIRDDSKMNAGGVRHAGLLLTHEGPDGRR